MLVDSVEVDLKAGRGGDGIVSWRREKFVPRGGPDGGDGGNGGHVYLQAAHDVDTLSSFRFRKVFQAEDGERGGSKKKTGAGGQDLELLVPVGTAVYNSSDGRLIVDMEEDGQRYRIAKGGRGGQGNVHFATATHQRPTEFTQGQPGEAVKVRLELRLVADIALIGQPNAGKSSLLKALTGIDARIGEYAFSTTQPQLGVAKVGDRSVILIDLPGLIEGAHQGKGLGDKFLQHTFRVKALFHLVDATSDIDHGIAEITNELQLFAPDILQKPRHLIINKVDLLSPAEQKALQKKYPDAILISAKEDQNLKKVWNLLAELVQ